MNPAGSAEPAATEDPEAPAGGQVSESSTQDPVGPAARVSRKQADPVEAKVSLPADETPPGQATDANLAPLNVGRSNDAPLSAPDRDVATRGGEAEHTPDQESTPQAANGHGAGQSAKEANDMPGNDEGPSVLNRGLTRNLSAMFEERGEARVEPSPPTLRTGRSQAIRDRTASVSVRCEACGERLFPLDKKEKLGGSTGEALVFHSTCFSCTQCKKTLNQKKVKWADGQVLCGRHFRQYVKDNPEADINLDLAVSRFAPAQPSSPQSPSLREQHEKDVAALKAAEAARSGGGRSSSPAAAASASNSSESGAGLRRTNSRSLSAYEAGLENQRAADAARIEANRQARLDAEQAEEERIRDERAAALVREAEANAAAEVAAAAEKERRRREAEVASAAREAALKEAEDQRKRDEAERVRRENEAEEARKREAAEQRRREAEVASAAREAALKEARAKDAAQRAELALVASEARAAAEAASVIAAENVARAEELRKRAEDRADRERRLREAATRRGHSRSGSFSSPRGSIGESAAIKPVFKVGYWAVVVALRRALGDFGAGVVAG